MAFAKIFSNFPVCFLGLSKLEVSSSGTEDILHIIIHFHDYYMRVLVF